jgi:hypothetical protein
MEGISPNLSMNNVDPLTERVLGFFVAKKLLRVPGVRPFPNTKLHVKDVLRVAEEVSPRIIEVLPAALIRFPKTFLHKEDLPENIKEVVSAITRGETEHPGIEGFRYADMKRWAEKELPDGRTKPVYQRKKMASFRLNGETLHMIDELSQEYGTSKGEVIEKAISHLSAES